MSPATFSVASTRKSRGRPQAAETEALMAPLIGILRELVDDAINAHVDQHEIEILQSVEEEERRVLLRLAKATS